MVGGARQQQSTNSCDIVSREFQARPFPHVWLSVHQAILATTPVNRYSLVYQRTSSRTVTLSPFSRFSAFRTLALMGTR